MTNIIYTGENQQLLNKILPYVYVGTRRVDEKIYIGARCANKVPAIDDLGTFYFTSSKNVVFDEFDWEILYIGNTREEVFEFEGELIDAYLKAGLLVNRRGTKGFYNAGVSPSETTRKKLRLAHTGKKKPLLTAEHKAKIGKAIKGKVRKSPPPKPLELRIKVSEFHKGKPKPQKVYTCPHCGKSGGNAIKYWHFDNCKKKINK